MKVLNLRCLGGHAFEGWFGSEDDYLQQQSRGLLSCPVCGGADVQRLPSAPRLNLSHAKPPVESGEVSPSRGAPSVRQTDSVGLPTAHIQALWVQAVREVLKRTEDVGDRFPEEARRIHYGDAEARGIRGQATPEEREALSEEGIEVVTLPVPEGLDGPTH